MKYYCGIDIGASTAKLVIIDRAGRIIAKAISRSGIDYAETAEQLLTGACASASINRSQIARPMPRVPPVTNATLAIPVSP